MGEDRISLLPDPLLCQILSELPTKNIVSTSVLSRRWKTLWLSVPVLDLNDLDLFDYNSFVTFVDNFLDFSKDSCLQQLKLSLHGHEDDDYSSNIKPWIDTATMRKVQHLDIQLRPRCIVRELMPLSIYICETLVCLKLSYVSLPDFEYVSLPGLRIMHLEMVRCFNDDTLLEKLISSLTSHLGKTVCDFSTSRRILDPFRSALTHNSICTEQWLKCEIQLTEKGAFTVKDLIAEIEFQDKLQRELGL